jgi:hypothetical protein
MSARNELSDRNVNKMKELFIDSVNNNELKNNFIFAYYDGSWDCQKITKEDTIYHIKTTSEDDIHHTFEKTIESFEMCLDNFDFDILIRINISSYINIRLIDRVAKSIDKDCIYANKLLVVTSDATRPNFLAPRGDFFITGRKTIEGIVKNSYIDGNRILDHVDDVLIGCSFEQYAGSDKYFKRLKQLSYGYFPNANTEFTLSDEQINTYLCYRLKTVPPTEKISGYSWKDNEYRLYDPKKMEHIHKLLPKDHVYKISDINKLVVNDDDIPCVAVQYVHTRLSDIKRYIEKVSR